MTEYNSVNVKLYYSQLNKLKSATKNATEVAQKLSTKLIGIFNNETIFPNILLVTDRQGSKLCKAYANNFSDNIKLSETQLSKIVQ